MISDPARLIRQHSSNFNTLWHEVASRGLASLIQNQHAPMQSHSFVACCAPDWPHSDKVRLGTFNQNEQAASDDPLVSEQLEWFNNGYVNNHNPPNFSKSGRQVM